MDEKREDLAAYVAHWMVNARGELVRREQPLDGCLPGPCYRPIDERPVSDPAR